MTPRHGLTDLLGQLTVVLDEIGDALVGLDMTKLLGTEERMAAVVAELRRVESDILSLHAFDEQSEQPASVVEHAQRARAALMRCRRLGDSFAAVARVRVPLCVGSGTYGPSGQLALDAKLDSVVKARV